MCSTSFLLYTVCSFICFISFNGGCFTTYIVHFVRSWCRIFKSPISLYALIILFNTFNRDRQRWNSIDVNERAYVVRNNQVHLIPPFALLGEHGCVVWGFNELFLLNFSFSFHVSSSHHILPQSACSALVSLFESLFCQCFYNAIFAVGLWWISDVGYWLYYVLLTASMLKKKMFFWMKPAMTWWVWLALEKRKGAI